MRAAVVILALVAATVMASEDVKITETLKSSLIAQMNGADAPPSNACGAGSVSLTGLTKTGVNADYKGNDQNYDYYMNVCAPSTTGGGDCNGKGLGICQYIAGGYTWVASLGTWTNAVWATVAGGVTATLKDGTECYIGGEWIVRTAVVTFTCGSTTSPTFTVGEDDKCNFALGFAANCGGGSNPDGDNGGGMSGGTILLILVIVLVPVYIVIGCIYKAKTKGTTGVESCPNVEFWRDLPGLVKDGFRFTFSKCRGGGGTYNQV